MKDFLYIIDDKMLFLSADEEISYRQAWKLVHHNISEKNKLTARKKSITEKYNCNYKTVKSFTDLENLITV
jgi:hypothetical protein